MEITSKIDNESAVFTLTGELDYNSYKDFNAKVGEQIERKTPKIALIMTGVSHIDSMGLGAITKLWKISEEGKLSLVLVDVPKNVRNMIKLVNLDRRIQLFDTLEEALS